MTHFFDDPGPATSYIKVSTPCKQRGYFARLFHFLNEHIIISNLASIAERRNRERYGISLAVILLGTACLHISAQYIEYPKESAKTQPLQLNGVPKMLTFDLELRGRMEDQTSLNYVTNNNQTYLLTRARGGMKIMPTTWLTGYLQFQDTHGLGLALNYISPTMRNTFDARQAYLQAKYKNVTVIAGRQELKYGSERLVGISDWTNNSRTWDGFLGRVGTAKDHVDFFSTSVVLVHPTSLDTHGAGLTFHGAAATLESVIPHTTLVPFVFIRALPRVISQQGIPGAELEVTPGIEVERNVGSFSYDVLGALQRGSFSNNSIHSGAGYVKAGYAATRLPWKPRLRLEYDYATGNSHRNAQRVSTFDQQYPSNHNAFGLTDLFGFQNIKERRFNLALLPAKNLTVLVQQEWLNVAAKQDNVYNGAAGIVTSAPAAGFRTNGLGREFDASSAYLFRKYLLFNIGVGHFSPDGAMTETRHGQPLTITYFGATYHFSFAK